MFCVISGSFGANLGANLAKFVTPADDATGERVGSTAFEHCQRFVPFV